MNRVKQHGEKRANFLRVKCQFDKIPRVGPQIDTGMEFLDRLQSQVTAQQKLIMPNKRCLENNNEIVAKICEEKLFSPPTVTLDKRQYVVRDGTSLFFHKTKVKNGYECRGRIKYKLQFVYIRQAFLQSLTQVIIASLSILPSSYYSLFMISQRLGSFGNH